jgi:O-antigen/teichoic acid export membrane protein
VVRRVVQFATRSRFIRNAMILTAGSFFAQLLPILFLPVLTRMFPPALFGVQALLQTGSQFLVPLASGQYELAIPTPRLQRRARALASVALLLTLAVCMAVAALVATVRAPLLALVHMQAVGYWAYALPVVVLSIATTNIANYWLLRMGKFGLQSVNKMVGAFSTALIAAAGGLWGIGYGLLLGFIGGVALNAICALAMACRHGFRPSWNEQPRYLRTIARQYLQFPLFGGLPSSITLLAAQIPLLIITAHYSLEVTGHYAVARNLMWGGTQLLAVCFGQVVLKHMTERMKQRLPIWGDYCKILAGLVAFGFATMVGVYIIGPWFFGWYLGDEWQESAEITRILALSVLFWFVGITAAQAAIALRKIKVIALWQVLYGLAACSLLLMTDLPFHQFLWRIVALEAVAYTLYVIMVSATIRRHAKAS